MTTLYGHRAPNTTARAPHWSDAALCRRTDPEAFFPAGIGAAVQQQIDDAKTFCTGCPVRLACATSAITNGWDKGVWGALDEGQRRRIVQRRPENLRQAIRDEWAKRKANPYFDAYASRTEQEDDGHVRWLIKSTSVTVLGRNYTPAQLGLILARGREPHGTTKATCGRPGCVAPEHLADDIVRWDRSRDAA
ncbi:WhiB family transcriptional regulator [Streptomyces sp. NPDC046685]|uniref:WhiB family transcriptional regulator n=1 Tax=Streptomyces sp. NPDC046685 TaxID=3157202 RepID=UPI0033DE8C1D